MISRVNYDGSTGSGVVWCAWFKCFYRCFENWTSRRLGSIIPVVLFCFHLSIASNCRMGETGPFGVVCSDSDPHRPLLSELPPLHPLSQLRRKVQERPNLTEWWRPLSISHSLCRSVLRLRLIYGSVLMLNGVMETPSNISLFVWVRITKRVIQTATINLNISFFA